MNAEQCCALAAGGIERQDHFTLARFGDGDLYCMKATTANEAAQLLQATLGDRPGRPPLALADGEQWSLELRDSLWKAWLAITSGDHKLLLGDPRTSGFGTELYPFWDTIRAGIQRRFIPVHHEMFWLTDQDQPELLRFCRAVKYSALDKLLVGRAELEPAADLIDAEFYEIEPFDSLTDAPWVVKAADPYPLVLLCAGRGGKAMIHGLLDPYRTIIDLGSLFDPLYIANSRPRVGAPSDEKAERFFSDLANRSVHVSPRRPGRAYG